MQRVAGILKWWQCCQYVCLDTCCKWFHRLLISQVLLKRGKIHHLVSKRKKAIFAKFLVTLLPKRLVTIYKELGQTSKMGLMYTCAVNFTIHFYYCLLTLNIHKLIYIFIFLPGLNSWYCAVAINAILKTEADLFSVTLCSMQERGIWFTVASRTSNLTYSVHWEMAIEENWKEWI